MLKVLTNSAAPLCEKKNNKIILEKVFNYDLSKVGARVQKYCPEIDLEKALTQYRYYIYLIAVTAKQSLVVPSREVDEVWHAAILFTRDYAHFCQDIAGHFIHHSPLDVPLNRKQAQFQSNQLKALSIKHFGYMVFDFSTNDQNNLDVFRCDGCDSCRECKYEYASNDCGSCRCS